LNITASARIKRVSVTIWYYVVMLLIAAIIIFPLWIMVSTSFFKRDASLSLIPKYLPLGDDFSLQAFQKLFARGNPITHWLLNSFLIALGDTLGQIVLCLMAAYPLARLRFKGRNFIFLLIICTLMIPMQTTMVPLYIVCMKLGLVNKYAGLLFPLMASPFTVFLLRQFMKEIPLELEESALIDGCNRYSLFIRIIVPLSPSGIAIVAILVFIGTWNEFLWPLIIINGVDRQVLSVGLVALVGSYGLYELNYPLLMGAALIMAFPLLLVYLFLQKFIMEAYMHVGIKG
jgi:ABC-type glycerol-3-phosphate transport system permease component